MIVTQVYYLSLLQILSIIVFLLQKEQVRSQLVSTKT